MKLNSLQVGDKVKYTYKNDMYTGIVVKHYKTICSELVNEKNTFSYELNKYHILLENNTIITFEDTNKDVVILDVKRKESLLI